LSVFICFIFKSVKNMSTFALVIRGDCLPANRRIYRNRVKPETYRMNTRYRRGERNDMTRSKRWGESARLRAQLTRHARQLLSWPPIGY
jgi:hypothetical protein